MDTATRWYHDLPYFFGGVFLAKMGPYFNKGVSGNPSLGRFASPPGEGIPHSTVNVLWGLFHLAVAYGLIAGIGRFDQRRTSHVVALGLGFLVFSLMMALI